MPSSLRRVSSTLIWVAMPAWSVPGQPEGGIALHPLEADEDILQGVVQGVAHVQLAGDVGGRHDDGEGLLLRVGHGVEAAAV